VTQQDAATSASIALEAKADGNSMKVIAALTMLFLPGTFLSSVFGMSMIKDEARWWLYVALTLPLTAMVVMTWWLWQSGLPLTRGGSSAP
jgi:Mg2+ and Co2+ transporter CorA